MAERDATAPSSAAQDSGAHSPEPHRRILGFSVNDDQWFAQLGPRVKSAAAGRIGPYELIAEAGRGGQGLVYRARQSRPDRDVALKRLAAGIFATPSMRARFEREIEAAAALEHPNIVSVYGTEEIDGQLIVALQWIDGVPLDEWVAGRSGRERRSLAEILGVFLKVCDAVQHAHQRGVIHRDLKPTNVLIDAADEPHVLDFGLARRHSDSSSDPRLTLSGAILGTPAFAPPEQLRGDRAAGDARGDVYSIGAMLYQALTGKMPVDPALSLHAMIEQIEHGRVPAPHLLDRSVSRDLSAIVMKAMHPDPKQRYASIDSLRADIQRFQRGEAVLAHPPSRLYVLRKFVRRNRAAVGIATTFALVLCCAAVTIAILYAQTRQALAEKTRANDRVVFELSTNRTISKFLQDVFISAGKSGPTTGSALTVRDVLDRTSEQLLEVHDWTDPASEAAIRMTVADTYRQLGLDAKAEPHYRAALELRRKALGDDALPVAEAFDAVARVERALGNMAEAEKYVELAWASYSKAVAPGDAYLARAANSVALVKRSLGKFDEAEAWYLKALEGYVRSFGPDSENVPYVRINLGALYVSMGRNEDAEASYCDAVTRARKLYGTTPNLEFCVATSSLADLLSKRGDPTGEADAMFVESLEGLIGLFGEIHPRVAWLRQRYAQHLISTHCFESAESELQSAERSFFALERWRDVAATVEMQAQLLRDTARNDIALDSLMSCFREIGGRLSATDPQLASLNVQIAAALLELREPVGATTHLHAAIDIYERSGPSYDARLRQAQLMLEQAEEK